MSLAAILVDPRRRNVAVLALSQALFMSVQGMGIAATPLAAYTLLDADHKWLATVPIFLVHLGIMGTTIPASLLMAVIGRRAGFSLGALSGVLFGLIGCVALYQRDFPLLCLASVFQGVQAAFFWYFRLAAADGAEPAYRAKAISLVMAGGVLAGLLGPQVAKWAADWLAPVTFAGVYLASSIFSLAVLALVQLVRIPRLTAEELASGGRPMREIARQPAYRVALASSVFGYAVMTLTMSATPLAMLACGFGFSDSATVIQAHIVAMFLPSFFTGHLIARFGVLPIIAAGGLIEFGCALVNLAGVDFANFFIANILVGFGWNFTYVGGSTLLTTTYEPAERAKVQASHDFMVYAATATAAALSGVLAAKAGWAVINLAAMPLMAVVTGAALWLMARQRRAASAAAE
ncbi:MAG: MFS transporter [Hyphomicrobiaceae bacterium]|nr:MAG: MFS transporter [Hyphomicrobiaceae bacterium]